MASGTPAKLDAAQSASAAQFNRQSEHYGISHILADTTDVAESLNFISPSQRGRALDVATGGGHAALRLAKMGWSVVAGDISERMLASAQHLIIRSGLTCKPVAFAAESMPFQDGSFDLVVSRVAAHHFSSPRQFLLEAARVLRPEGHLLLIDGSVPDGDPDTEEWLHKVEQWRDPSHVGFLSRASWEALVKAAGLEILRSSLHPKRQPDLDWYFKTAGTTAENQAKVLGAVRSAPEGVRRALDISEIDGKIGWTWPILRLVARKPAVHVTG
jgi:ubiquinone/menaquinone biosynthesis C-methylase UbiE